MSWIQEPNEEEKSYSLSRLLFEPNNCESFYCTDYWFPVLVKEPIN